MTEGVLLSIGIRAGPAVAAPVLWGTRETLAVPEIVGMFVRFSQENKEVKLSLSGAITASTLVVTFPNPSQ